MNEVERMGLLVRVVELLNNAGSWTGRTHIQKFVYFAQETLGLESNYEFILYQRGPFSFDLDDDIRSLRSVGGVDIASAPPYGPSYHPTPFGKSLIDKARISPDMEIRLATLAYVLSSQKTARDLELLGTTLFAMSEGQLSQEDVVLRVMDLKPHFTRHQVNQAFASVLQIRNRLSSEVS
jgi:uncharacterized protein YwgA